MSKSGPIEAAAPSDHACTAEAHARECEKIDKCQRRVCEPALGFESQLFEAAPEDKGGRAHAQQYRGQDDRDGGKKGRRRDTVGGDGEGQQVGLLERIILSH